VALCLAIVGPRHREGNNHAPNNGDADLAGGTWRERGRYPRIFGAEFRQRVTGMGTTEVLTAPRSPWQNPFAERLNGTIRRELLDHVIVLNEGHLRRRLRSHLRYYHGSRR